MYLDSSLLCFMSLLPLYSLVESMCAMSTYKSSPLGNEKESIRLIQVLSTGREGNITLDFHNTTLGRSKFVALSCCWGVEPASHKITSMGINSGYDQNSTRSSSMQRNRFAEPTFELTPYASISKIDPRRLARYY